MTKIFLSVIVACLAMQLTAKDFVFGGQFRDRILPMPGNVTLETLQQSSPSVSIWGAEGSRKRYTDNGIEDASMNYWGGNIYQDTEGTYHLFVAGWDGTTRPFSYWPNSDVYHATSKNVWGPYTNAANIGKGHNPNFFVAQDGTYVCYALINNSSAWRYTSKSLNGPWKFEPMPLDLRDRALSTGSATTYSNWTFAGRADGSQYCMDRGGALWISEDGLKPFEQILGSSCYPNGGGGTFEDPVVWRDDFQYHMIVNDWKARIAYYSRSYDGYHWVYEDGVAYDIDVSVHPDGVKEEWYKYERPRVFQDKYGRATQLNMAVIDTIKAHDLANDNHSSKNIVMPLNPGLLAEVLNTEKLSTETSAIRVKIQKEPGFVPSEHIDIATIRFGSYATVNVGGGAVCLSSETDADGNLILTFSGKDTGISDGEFAPKLIGRYVAGYTNPATPTAPAGGMCYGYARLPYIDYEPAYLSPSLPSIGVGSMLTSLPVKNYGLATSGDAVEVKVLSSNNVVLAKGTVPSLQSYSSADVPLQAVVAIPTGSKVLKVAFYTNGKQTDTHILQLEAVNKAQAYLTNAVSEANTLLGNSSFNYGREALSAALYEAKKSENSFYEPEITSAVAALTKAVNVFKFANATASRPVSITVNGADMASTEAWEILHEGDGADFHINSSNNHDYNQLGSNPFLEAYSGKGITCPNYARQTIDALPAGRYTLEADVIAQRNTGGCDGVTIFLGENVTACSSSVAGRSEHYTVECTLDKEGSLTFGVNVAANSSATWLGVDNIVLKYYGDGSHDNDVVMPDVTLRYCYINTATSSSGRIYLYADASSGYLRRQNTLPGDNGVFTVITDNENGRVYMYNQATRTFVVPKAGNGSSFWTLSSSEAACISGIEASTTVSGAYIIKGDPSSSNQYNYMNAYGGTASHNEVASYTAADKGSQWTLTEIAGDNSFTTVGIVMGKEDFLATLHLVNGIMIDGRENVITSAHTPHIMGNLKVRRFYNLGGQQTTGIARGLNIVSNEDGTIMKVFVP